MKLHLTESENTLNMYHNAWDPRNLIKKVWYWRWWKSLHKKAQIAQDDNFWEIRRSSIQNMCLSWFPSLQQTEWWVKYKLLSSFFSLPVLKKWKKTHFLNSAKHFAVWRALTVSMKSESGRMAQEIKKQPPLTIASITVSWPHVAWKLVVILTCSCWLWGQCEAELQSRTVEMQSDVKHGSDCAKQTPTVWGSAERQTASQLDMWVRQLVWWLRARNTHSGLAAITWTRTSTSSGEFGKLNLLGSVVVIQDIWVYLAINIFCWTELPI